ncbi:hypothetical protein [Georgenia sunbinii]|uniref:hypothetical protein n=1 Tax=Georgenia sunbinii TaxID=3117728 RepID=UPI002F2642E1
MSATSDAMNQFAANLVRLARRPGLLLLVAAAVPVAVFAFLAFLVGRQAETGAGWTLFVLSLVLALPILVLAVRRERLRARTDGADGPLVAGGVVDRPAAGEEDPRLAALQDEMGTWNEAVSETQIRTARWLPRVEATQRALVRAAGGTVNAPYLRDDLRITLVAFLGTVVAIPLGVLGTFVTAFTLLLG